MKKTPLFCLSLLLLSAFQTASVRGVVAEGYPDWTGVTPKNYIWGRVLASDAELRQRAATVVVEFDAEKATEQLNKAGGLAELNGYGKAVGATSGNWETIALPHDVMVIFVAKNAKDTAKVLEAMKQGDHTKNAGIVLGIKGNCAPIYRNVTFAGAPDDGGKLPFVYVLGYEGTTPLVKEAYADKKTEAAVKAAIAAQRKKLAEAQLKWRPFYGYVEEPKFYKDLEKQIEKGKPLDAYATKLLKGVTSKEAERAREAQIIYDALEQTRGDYMTIIQGSYASRPHVAAYTIGQLTKYWPKTRKQMSDIADKIKSNNAAQPIIKMYPKIMQWADPNFTCKSAAESKKIVGELEKMRKSLDPLKEDAKNITLQNAALIIDTMLEELITTMPNKVPAK